MGGCARRGYSRRRTRCGRARAREDPAGEGPAGPFRDEPYSAGFSFGLGAGKGSGLKSSQPMGMVNTWSSATVICSVSILLTIAIPLISKLYSLGLDFTEKTVFLAPFSESSENIMRLPCTEFLKDTPLKNSAPIKYVSSWKIALSNFVMQLWREIVNTALLLNRAWVKFDSPINSEL